MLDFEEIRAEEQNGTNVTGVKTAAIRRLGRTEMRLAALAALWTIPDTQYATQRRRL